MKVEICVTSADAAIIAEQAGADRLELCAELAVGGITPSAGLLQTVREAVQIPIHVLIRPRSGDFTYSEAEFSQMLRDITYCRDLGFDGIVTGCLQSDRRVDQDRMQILSAAAGGLHLTFHRAFDRIPDWQTALGQLESLGVNTILTSGQAVTAQKGLGLLQKLTENTRCGIMPGGGIGPAQLNDFIGKGFEAVHLSALPKTTAEIPTTLPLNTPALLREGAPLMPDRKLIEAVVTRLRSNLK